MPTPVLIACIALILTGIARLAHYFHLNFVLPTIGQTRSLQLRVEQTLTPDELAVQLQAFGEALIARIHQDRAAALHRANINYTTLIHNSLDARPHITAEQLQPMLDHAQLLALPQLRETILAAIPEPVVPVVQLDPEAFRLLLQEHHQPDQPQPPVDGQPQPGELARRLRALAPHAQHALPFPDPLDRNPEEIFEDAVTDRYANPGMALTDIFHRGFLTQQVHHASGRVFWKATIHIPAEDQHPAIDYELEPHTNTKALKATLRELISDMY